MRSREDQEKLTEVLMSYGWSDRNPRLFDIFGQTMFPIYGESGSVRTSAAMFLVEHGDVEDFLDGFTKFSDEHLGIVDFGKGWRAISIHLPFDADYKQVRNWLEIAEGKLKETKCAEQLPKMEK